MSLTTAQKISLLAAINADNTMSVIPKNSDGAYAIANLLNLDAPTVYIVWRPTTHASDIMDAITWAALTPNDALSTTNQVLICQAKQLNLQILLQGRDTIATGKTNVRGGLSDALLNVPSGNSGNVQDAGWLGTGKVKATISRQASVVEKLFAVGAGTAGTPSSLVVEGPISPQDVESCWG